MEILPVLGYYQMIGWQWWTYTWCKHEWALPQWWEQTIMHSSMDNHYNAE